MFGKPKYDVLVVGAGPVGLVTALSLVERGFTPRVVDTEWSGSERSYALALHPSALDLMARFGVKDALLAKSRKVETVGLYDGAERKAGLELGRLETPSPYLAVMGQNVLEAVLTEALAKKGVSVEWNHRVAVLDPGGRTGVRLTLDTLERDDTGYAVPHAEWVVAKSQKLEVPYVIGADGHRSVVRRALGFEYPEVAPAQHFAVFEFDSDDDLGSEMKLLLGDDLMGVAWPLPGGRVRFSFELKDAQVPEGTRSRSRRLVVVGNRSYPALDEALLFKLLSERAPWFKGRVGHLHWSMAIRFERRLSTEVGKERCWLLGDAVHMTGPAAVQSMNAGFAEAEGLAEALKSAREGHLEGLKSYRKDTRAAWKCLLGMSGGLRPGPSAAPWIAGHAARLMACIPSTGAHLAGLAAQLGLTLPPRSELLAASPSITEG